MALPLPYYQTILCLRRYPVEGAHLAFILSAFDQAE